MLLSSCIPKSVLYLRRCVASSTNDRNLLRTLTPSRVTSKCDPYDQKGKPLTLDVVRKLLPLHPGWQYADAPHLYAVNGKATFATNGIDGNGGILYKEWAWTDYRQASWFVSRIGNVAHGESQYPLLLNVKAAENSCFIVAISLGTLPLNGLSYSDFLLSLRIDTVITSPQWTK